MPDGSACVACPKGCLLCLYADSCIATTVEEVMLFMSGSEVGRCHGFVVDDSCWDSCRGNRYPVFNKTIQKLECIVLPTDLAIE